jgi:hypothetical protein
MQCSWTILSTTACSALQYFPTLSHKWHDFLKKVTENTMCVLIFSTTFIWNISHFKKKWATYDKKMYIGLHVKYPLYFSDFNEIWIYSADFRKILKYQISWKSVQWGPSCFMWTDRWTVMTKLIFAPNMFSYINFESPYRHLMWCHSLSLSNVCVCVCVCV